MTLAHSDNCGGGGPKKVGALSYSLCSLYENPALISRIVLSGGKETVDSRTC
jgi:hypothetical protein